MNKFLYFLTFLIGVPIIFLSFTIIYHFFNVSLIYNGIFWEFNVVDFSTYLLTIFISIFIAIILTERSTKIYKKKELIIDLLNKIEDSLKIIYSLALTLNNSKSKKKDRSEILLNFENIDRKFIIITKKGKKVLNCDLDKFNIQLFDYKKFITDSPFMSKVHYSDERLYKIRNCYNLLCETIHCNRFQLYD